MFTNTRTGRPWYWDWNTRSAFPHIFTSCKTRKLKGEKCITFAVTEGIYKFCGNRGIFNMHPMGFSGVVGRDENKRRSPLFRSCISVHVTVFKETLFVEKFPHFPPPFSASYFRTTTPLMVIIIR